MTYRFVHTADVHLDSPLRSLALRDPDLADLIGNATRRAFIAIIDLCLAEQADALLLAGDLYDGDQTSMKTARFLAEQLRRLHQAGIAVFIIRGNHDALSRITKELTFPDSVTLFGGRAEAIAVDRTAADTPITIHGLSFARPHAPESLISRYKPPVEGAVNIALMHTSLNGAPGHDPYAPCTVVDLDDSGFDYWALGHIHKRSIPQSRRSVVMPGMPQGRDIGESGPKSVTLVTIRNDKSVLVEERLTSIAQFEHVAIDLTGVDDWRDAITALEAALQHARGQTQSEHLVARLRFTGSTPLAWRLRRDRDLLREEAVNRASLTGKTWIDKIDVDSKAPGSVTGPVADPISELRRFITEDITASPAYQMEIETIAEELRTQLPPECRAFLGTDEATFKRTLTEIVNEGAEDVLARLHATTGMEPG